MKHLSLIFMLVLLVGQVAFAQRTVTGTVTDVDGEPLISANVVLKGTSEGTLTNFDGKYTINIPTGMESPVLVISYIGFETQELEVGVSNVIDCALSEGVTLDVAVVTALGIQRDEKAIGYAVQEVDADEISKAKTNNFIDALSGKAAGVNITRSSGAAGAPSRIVLRGQTSLSGDNEALIVVDGVRIDNSEFHTERSLGGVANSSRAMDIDPDNIESVTVLKGAAATALYGVDGARGVLVITTKKGGQGDSKFNVSFGTNMTFSQVTQQPALQNRYAQGFSGDYLAPETGASTSWGPLVSDLEYDGATDYVYDPNGRLVPVGTGNGVPANVYDNVDDFYRTGFAYNNNVAISGGSDVATFRLTFGNARENGVVPKNTYNRTNVGLAGSANLFDDRLHASTTINYIKSGGTKIQQGSNLSGINLGLYRTPVTFDNSNGLDDPANDPLAYTRPDGGQRNYRGGGGYDNPYWIINNSPFNDDVNRVQGNIQLAYDLTDWLTVSTNIGSDAYSDTRKQIFEVGSRNAPAGQVIEDEIHYRNIDAYLNFAGNKAFGDEGVFSLGYNLGGNIYNTYSERLTVQGDGLSFSGFPELANTATKIVSSTVTETKNASVFGSLDFGFRNMLYLTITGRQDWVSTLIVPGKEFSAGDIGFFYPSASLSWVFTELFDNNILSFGKIRLSYAEVGGGAPNAYLTSTTFLVPPFNQGTVEDLNDGWTNGIGFPFSGNTAFSLTNVQGSTELKPERTRDYEAGIDLRFFNGRLGLDFTYYNRESSDQILTVPISGATGFNRAVLNTGQITTTGLELVLTASPVSNKNFTWDIAINFDSYRSIVDELAEGVPRQYLDGFTGTGIYNIPGEAYGQLYGGIFLRDDAGNLIIDSDPTSATYGYPQADGQAILGDPNPDFRVGINNSFSFKGVSLSFLFDIKQGGEMWNGTKGALTFFGRSELTEDRDLGTATSYVFPGVLADGTPNNIEVGLNQDWYLGNGGGFGDVAENFIEDASFYRLRLVTLSYSMKNEWFENTPFRDVRISFTGRNLLLFTPYTGVDPETSLVGSSSNGQGLEYFQFPGTKSFGIGLNLNFR